MTNVLKFAEGLDALRIIPRAILAGYCWFVIYITTWILGWYFNLPVAERSIESSGLVLGLFTSITGMGSWFLKIYIQSGRKWNGPPEGE